VERGYDLATHTFKSLNEIEGQAFDAVITMGCGDACPWVASPLHEDWALADPRNLDEDGYRSARDEIERRVSGLLAKLA
jgi:arsenate reductase